jgi:hypothetical protein
MGFTAYSVSDRLMRSTAVGYTTKSRDDIFTQNKEHRLHESMDPKGAALRESRDSETHPNTVPVQFWLDVTGSMRDIPHQLIKEDLPKLISALIQNGVPDVALLFGAIGDHECDRCPLQVAQYESGDAELDMWLTRTYLEGGGGGNAGESYLLAWYYAAYHAVHDAYEKRGKKGYVFTVGDEPTLRNLPLKAVKEIMGDAAVGQATYTAEQLYEKASETNHVYHIHIKHGNPGSEKFLIEGWKNLLGQNFIVIEDKSLLARTIADIVIAQEEKQTGVKPTKPADVKPGTTQEILL